MDHQIIALAVEVEGVMLVVVYVFLHIDLVVDKYLVVVLKVPCGHTYLHTCDIIIYGNVRMYFHSFYCLLRRDSTGAGRRVKGHRR